MQPMNLTPPSPQHIQHHRRHQHKSNGSSNNNNSKPGPISCSQYSTQISLGIRNLMLLSPPLNPTVPSTHNPDCIAANDHLNMIYEKPLQSIISSNAAGANPNNDSGDQCRASFANNKPNLLKFSCPKPSYKEPLSPGYSTGTANNGSNGGTRLFCSSVAYLHTPPPSVLCKSASYFSSSEDEEDENDYDSDDYEEDEDDDEYGEEDYFNLKFQKLSSQTYQRF
jgi:hypothetical protein